MNILLAIDPSKASQVAVDEMAARPWPPGSVAEVLSVVEPAHLWTMSITSEEAERRAKELVERAAAQLTASGLPAKGATEHGDPKTVILDRLAAGGADLAVVGSHGVSAVTRFLLGNVASAIVRHAPCSVEVVRSRNGVHPVRKILLATDGSEYSNVAARSIASRPWPKDTEVRVLSVVEFVLPATQAFLEPPLFPSAHIDELRQEAMQRAHAAIASAVEILAPAGLRVSESLSVLLKSPKEVILDEAAEWGADLIVVGSHGRRGLDRFLMGSVAESVASHANCSVEVARAKG